MSGRTIRLLKVANFKSIDSLEIQDISQFSVFAGANGSGKSNFFDALDFIRLFVESGIEAALRQYGRYENIHSEKRRARYARKLEFQIQCELADNREDKLGEIVSFHYDLAINDIDKSPTIEEKLRVNNQLLLNRIKGEPPKIIRQDGKSDGAIENFPDSYSALLLFTGIPISLLLRNIKVYRIDPYGAKEPDQCDQDPYVLDRKGHNLASVLNRLEKNENLRNIIMEWMELIAPGIEKIQTEQQQIDSKTAILFKESGTRRRFPAHMVSDGTIYALSLLVAVLDQSNEGYGLTLIEEPERGVHPKAIWELIGFIRQQATANNPIWLSTHSESVVRQLKLDELILVDKIDGRTQMKPAWMSNITQDNMAPLGLDEIWLSNLLNGGLPW